MGLPKRIQSQPERPTQGRHNVMPARIAGGHLLLEHTDETASSEAASQRRIWQRKLFSKPNGGGGTQAINSESRPNWAELNYEQDNLFIWSRCYLGKAPFPDEIHSLFSMKHALRETSKKCPWVQTRFSFYTIGEWCHSASTLERSAQMWWEMIWKCRLVNNH